MNGLRASPSTADPTGWVVVAGGALAVLTLGLWTRIGAPALVLPLAAAGAAVLVQRPAWAVGLLVGAAVLGERADDGLLPAFTALYEPLPGGPTPLELLLGLAVLAVVVDVQRRGGAPRPPLAFALPIAIFALAIVSGALTGLFAGVGPKDLLFAGRQLPFLVVVPALVFFVVRTDRDARVAIGLAAGAAALKAVLGIAAILLGRGLPIAGSRITYYEPAANALMLLVLLGVVAALLMRARPPAWVLLCSPLLLVALAYSFRRSFWIGGALGLVLLLLLASSPLGRRLIVACALLAVAAAWALASVGFQAAGPLVEHARTLEPSRLTSRPDDRYRIDERANVLAELGRHPVTGLGLGVPWFAEHPLPVEHRNGRQYTHVVLLWHWLKLGLLGIAGYVAVLLGAGRLAYRQWRRHPDPLLRAAGLAALCWLASLAVVETTASFTGVDLRFTVLLGAVLGVLGAVAARRQGATTRTRRAG